ncbi:MAG: LysR family transcriptional regulator [Pseudomonadota bacterium]
MEWDDLKYVLAAYRSRSFARAASLLKVSHTTIGRRISALEASLGQTLFSRTRDGCEPTDLCEKIVKIAERMEADVRRAATIAAATPDEPEGLVQVNTASWIINHLLIPALPRLYESAPKIQISFVGDVVEDKRGRTEHSFSLRFDVMAHRSELEIELANFTYAIYGKRHIRGDEANWVSTFGGSVVMKTFGWLEKQNVAFNDIRLLADDAELVQTAIRNGIGKGLIPTYLGERDPDLQRLSGEEPELTRCLRALVPRHIARTPEITTVLNWVEQVVKEASI